MHVDKHGQGRSGFGPVDRGGEVEAIGLCPDETDLFDRDFGSYCGGGGAALLGKCGRSAAGKCDEAERNDDGFHAAVLDVCFTARDARQGWHASGARAKPSGLVRRGVGVRQHGFECRHHARPVGVGLQRQAGEVAHRGAAQDQVVQGRKDDGVDSGRICARRRPGGATDALHHAEHGFRSCGLDPGQRFGRAGEFPGEQLLQHGIGAEISGVGGEGRAHALGIFAPRRRLHVADPDAGGGAQRLKQAIEAAEIAIDEFLVRASLGRDGVDPERACAVAGYDPGCRLYEALFGRFPVAGEAGSVGFLALDNGFPRFATGTLNKSPSGDKSLDGWSRSCMSLSGDIQEVGMKIVPDNRSKWIGAGLALSAVAVVSNAPYSALIALFDYDDVLRRFKISCTSGLV